MLAGAPLVRLTGGDQLSIIMITGFVPSRTWQLKQAVSPHFPKMKDVFTNDYPLELGKYKPSN